MIKKPLVIILSAAIIFTQINCTPYNQITLPKEELVTNQQIKENFSNYNVYVHDKAGTYRLNDPILNGDKVQGLPTPVMTAEDVQAIKAPRTKKELKAHKYDLNIYTQKDVIPYSASTGSGDPQPGSFTLENKDVDHLSVYAVNKKKPLEAIAIVAIVVVSVLAIVLIGVAVAGSDGNGSNSGGSDSGSGDSGSGGSGSGGSGSGSGSDSGSGGSGSNSGS
jgi:hypothetical protein